MCVPVQVGGKAAGSLGVTLPYDRERDFAREAELLGVVASMIGQAVRVHTLVETEGQRLLMENDQLRQELRERYEFRNIKKKGRFELADGGHCSWTRWVSCPHPLRSSSCEPSRRGSSSGWAE